MTHPVTESGCTVYKLSAQYISSAYGKKSESELVHALCSPYILASAFSTVKLSTFVMWVVDLNLRYFDVEQ